MEERGGQGHKKNSSTVLDSVRVFKDSLESNQKATQQMKEDELLKAKETLEKTVAQLQEALQVHKEDIKLNAVLVLTLNNSCLAYKQLKDYRKALLSLKNIMIIEASIGVSRLEIAITHLNISTILFHLADYQQSIDNINCAKDVLVGEINQLYLRGNQIDQSYKRKLYLNLILAYFNRAVALEKQGFQEQAKKNFDQCVDLTNRKFGSDSQISKMISKHLQTDAQSERNPFFVAKTINISEITQQTDSGKQHKLLREKQTALAPRETKDFKSQTYSQDQKSSDYNKALSLPSELSQRKIIAGKKVDKNSPDRYSARSANKLKSKSQQTDLRAHDSENEQEKLDSDDTYFGKGGLGGRKTLSYSSIKEEAQESDIDSEREILNKKTNRLRQEIRKVREKGHLSESGSEDSQNQTHGKQSNFTRLTKASSKPPITPINNFSLVDSPKQAHRHKNSSKNDFQKNGKFPTYDGQVKEKQRTRGFDNKNQDLETNTLEPRNEFKKDRTKKLREDIDRKKMSKKSSNSPKRIESKKKHHRSSPRPKEQRYRRKNSSGSILSRRNESFSESSMSHVQNHPHESEITSSFKAKIPTIKYMNQKAGKSHSRHIKLPPEELKSTSENTTKSTENISYRNKPLKLSKISFALKYMK